MNDIISKAGIHSVGGNRTGYGAFLQRISEAGRRLSVVVCYDDYGAIDEPLALWPETLTIGGETSWDDAPYDVDLAFDRIIVLKQRKPGLKYIKYFNERNGDWPQQADFYIALMDRLYVDAPDIGLCIFDCASGTPPYPDEPGGHEAYTSILRVCDHAKRHDRKVILGLHEYVSEGGTIGRYQRLADYLDAYNAFVPIVITEYGFETFPGTSQFMAMVQNNDPIYMRDKRVLGYATWTLGGGGWAGSNYATALPQLSDYIAMVEPIAPAPDPVPVPPPSSWRRFGGIIDQQWTDDLSQWIGDHGGMVLIEDVSVVIK